MTTMDQPPGSRLFIVCGKSVEEETLLEAFRAYGNIQHIKLLRDKGVAYIKMSRASEAALAIEHLHETVLDHGRGPKIKCMVAEAASSRRSIPGWPMRPPSPVEVHADPDNIPPRSRLFLVVPKTADANLITDYMSQYPDIQYCKTDLIAAKGIVFCKFSKASSALHAMELVNETGIVAGYKVKCLLAEPKGKKSTQGLGIPGLDVPPMLAGLPMDALGADLTGLNGVGGLPGLSMMGPAAAQPDYGNMRTALGTLLGLQSGMTNASLMAQLQAMSPAPGAPGYDPAAAFAGQPSYAALTGLTMPYNQGIMGAGLGGPVASGMTTSGGSLGVDSSEARHRLFVVVHKSVTEEQLMHLFSTFAGLEYCDLKRERDTGESKGFAFVSYATHDSAALAIANFHNIEFPPGTGHWMKVMHAEPQTTRPLPRSPPGHGSPLASPLGGGGGHPPHHHHHHPSVLSPGTLASSTGTPPQGPPSIDQHSLSSSLFGGLDSITPRQEHRSLSSTLVVGTMGGDQHTAAAAAVPHYASSSIHSPQHQPHTPRGGPTTPTPLFSGGPVTTTTTPGASGGVFSPNTTDTASTTELPTSPLLHHGSMSAGDAKELLAIQASLSLAGSYGTPREGGHPAIGGGTPLTNTSAAGQHPGGGGDSGSYGGESTKGSLTYEPTFGSPTAAAGGGGPAHGNIGLPHVSLSAGGSASPVPSSPPIKPPHDGWPSSDGAPLTPGPSGGARPGAASDDGTVVYTMLSRPLPDYSLRHVFERCGVVEAVQLSGADQRVGAVKFATTDAAAAALQLDGSELLGETLHVVRDDPLTMGRGGLLGSSGEAAAQCC